MKFDHDLFFSSVKARFADLANLRQQQVNGLEFLLIGIENDPKLERIEWPAYMLGTTGHETAYTFQPIHEYGGRQYFINRYGGQTALGKRLGNDTPEEGALYAGEGDVQVTGEGNFEKAEDAMRREYPEVIAAWEARTGKVFDLTVGDQPDDELDPQNASDPAIAYCIMSYGMRTGMFTGHKLGEYLNDRQTDYLNARRIINGDVAINGARIAQRAKGFEQALRAALIP